MAEEKKIAGPRNFQLNLVEVVDIACRVLHQAIVLQAKDKAKQVLKDLKAGKGIKIGELTLTAKNDVSGEEEKLTMPFKIRLDYSEFRGPFNFPAFEASVRETISRIGQTLNEKGNLNILTEQETGAALIHLPGVIQDADGRFNVMVMVIEPMKEHKLSLAAKLLYLNPDQYEQLRDKSVDVTADEADAAE